MATQLSPCPACSRHVRSHERQCPFCAASLEIAGQGSTFFQVREQAAAVFVGVTLALAACNTRTEQTTKQAEPSEVKPVPPETKPATNPGAVLAPSTIATPPEPRLNAPAYGIAPAPPPSPAPIYGAPPRPKMKYGAPPPPRKP